MIDTARQRLRILVVSTLERHHDISTAVEELVAAVDDEIESRAADRVADLRQQLERGDIE